MSTDHPLSPVRQAPLAPSPSKSAATVYAEIAELLRNAGWARGAGRDSRSRYSLRTAVEAVVASTGSDAGERVGRSARCCNHLRELAGTTNIDAWNDAPERRRDELFELLGAASRLHPRD
jgi:hypothetical protein